MENSKMAVVPYVVPFNEERRMWCANNRYGHMTHVCTSITEAMAKAMCAAYPMPEIEELYNSEMMRRAELARFDCMCHIEPGGTAFDID